MHNKWRTRGYPVTWPHLEPEISWLGNRNTECGLPHSAMHRPLIFRTTSPGWSRFSWSECLLQLIGVEATWKGPIIFLYSPHFFLSSLLQLLLRLLFRLSALRDSDWKKVHNIQHRYIYLRFYIDEMLHVVKICTCSIQYFLSILIWCYEQRQVKYKLLKSLRKGA
jgi:hypothetical protein